MKLITRFLPIRRCALLCLFPLCLPAAVQYTLSNPGGIDISFIAPDFITNFAPDQVSNGQSIWFLPRPVMLVSPCDAYTRYAFVGVTCSTSLYSQDDQNVAFNAVVHNADGTEISLYGVLGAFPIPPDQFGSAQSSNFTFSISPTDAGATYAPEPQTWMLLLTGFTGIYLAWRRKRSA